VDSLNMQHNAQTKDFFHAISPAILNHLPLQTILKVNINDFL
jgi:hypothetical protein